MRNRVGFLMSLKLKIYAGLIFLARLNRLLLVSLHFRTGLDVPQVLPKERFRFVAAPPVFAGV